MANDTGDRFDDIMSRQDRGIYAGSLGGDEYESLGEELTQDGNKITMSCRACGNRYGVTVEWRELYIIGRNEPGRPPILPPGWNYSAANRSVYPTTAKCRCGTPLCPHLTPDEARKVFNQGLHAGFVTDQQFRSWKHEMDSYLQSQGG